MEILQARQALYKKALNYKTTEKWPLFHIEANLVFQAYIVKTVWFNLLFLLNPYVSVFFRVSMTLKSVTNISFLPTEFLQLSSTETVTSVCSETHRAIYL